MGKNKYFWLFFHNDNLSESNNDFQFDILSGYNLYDLNVLKSILEQVSSNDLIFASFPCNNFSYANGSIYKREREREGSYMQLIDEELKAIYFTIDYCTKNNLKLIIENPRKSRLWKFINISASFYQNIRIQDKYIVAKNTGLFILNCDVFGLEQINKSNITYSHGKKSKEDNVIKKEHIIRFSKELINHIKEYTI
jgi:site-specific DNA-cytosine methylase